MIYFDDPIFETQADVIVVPVDPTGEGDIEQFTLHQDLMACVPEFGKRYTSDLRRKQYVPGDIKVFYVRDDDTGLWLGRWFIEFPVFKDLSFHNFTRQISQAITLTKRMDVDTMAVEDGIGRWLGGVEENAWELHERMIRGPEIWFYTTQADFIEEKVVPKIVEATA